MSTCIVSDQTKFVAGIFRFALMAPESTCGADPNDLLETAKAWAKERPGFRSLQVRRCGKDEIGIEFCYGLQPGETRAKFVYGYTDKLKRQYGNALATWDVSDDLEILK